MPSIHIPEDVWADLLLEYGDRKDARDAVKEAAREKANE